MRITLIFTFYRMLFTSIHHHHHRRDAKKTKIFIEGDSIIHDDDDHHHYQRHRIHTINVKVNEIKAVGI